MYVHAFKLTASAVLMALALIGGLLPISFRDCVSARGRSFMSLFAGGIFLSGSLLHLLPDAVENEPLKCMWKASCGTLVGELIPYFFFGVGFLVILMLELFAHEVHTWFADERERDDASDGTSSGEEEANEDANHYREMSENELLLQPTSLDYGAASHDHHQAPKAKEPDVEGCQTVPHEHTESLLTTGELKLVDMIVFISLSFHSVMEGVAIGSQATPAYDIFIAVVAHKALAAFALGLEMITHGVSTRRLLFSMIVFSLMTPAGVGLGSLIIHGEGESAQSGVCTALSAGTFLYVAVMEIIPQELENRQDQCLKGLSLCLGFAAFGTLAIWA